MGAAFYQSLSYSFPGNTDQWKYNQAKENLTKRQTPRNTVPNYFDV